MRRLLTLCLSVPFWLLAVFLLGDSASWAATVPPRSSDSFSLSVGSSWPSVGLLALADCTLTPTEPSCLGPTPTSVGPSPSSSASPSSPSSPSSSTEPSLAPTCGTPDDPPCVVELGQDTATILVLGFGLVILTGASVMVSTWKR